MDYLQLKHSVERLTECLKVLPKEDRKPLQHLISVYNDKLKSISYIDEYNTFFDKNEIRHIGKFMYRFRERNMKPYHDRVGDISLKISIDCGCFDAEKNYFLTRDRIDKIAEYYSENNWNNKYAFIEKTKNKSKIYAKAYKNWETKENVFWDLLDENIDYLDAKKTVEKMERLLNDFDIDLTLKNLIAYRSRNMNKSQISIDVIIRESISTEIEKQWIDFNK